MNDHDPSEPLSVFVTPDHEVFSSLSSPSPPADLKNALRLPSPSSKGPSKSTPSSKSSSLLGPLMYQSPQGMVYGAPSSNGVLFGLPQGGSNQPQFITIPFSMVTADGQGCELDLTGRK